MEECESRSHVLSPFLLVLVMFVLVACMQVKFTGYKERPVEERKRKFVEDLHEGHSVIVSSSVFANECNLYRLHHGSL